MHMQMDIQKHANLALKWGDLPGFLGCTCMLPATSTSLHSYHWNKDISIESYRDTWIFPEDVNNKDFKPTLHTTNHVDDKLFIIYLHWSSLAC